MCADGGPSVLTAAVLEPVSLPRRPGRVDMDDDTVRRHPIPRWDRGRVLSSARCSERRAQKQLSGVQTCRCSERMCHVLFSLLGCPRARQALRLRMDVVLTSHRGQRQATWPLKGQQTCEAPLALAHVPTVIFARVSVP